MSKKKRGPFVRGEVQNEQKKSEVLSCEVRDFHSGLAKYYSGLAVDCVVYTSIPGIMPLTVHMGRSEISRIILHRAQKKTPKKVIFRSKKWYFWSKKCTVTRRNIWKPLRQPKKRLQNNKIFVGGRCNYGK